MDEHLNEHRRNHTLGVRETALKLAGIYGADKNKAEAAAKLQTTKQLLNYKIKKYGIGK